jgi:predicted esterase
MRFSTEDFITAVVRDVEARLPIDRRSVFTLSWASGGPAAYAASLDPATPITGSFIAMSIFPTDALPSLSRAKGHRYFLLHPENTPIASVKVGKRAQETLRKNGAAVELVTYPGGYGWFGDVYAQVRRGIRYLEQ